MAAWGAWFGSLGDTVVDAGNPFGDVASVAADGSVADGGAAGLTGYSILSAGDIDDGGRPGRRLPDPRGRRQRRGLRGRPGHVATPGLEPAGAEPVGSGPGGFGVDPLPLGDPAPRRLCPEPSSSTTVGGRDRHVLDADPLAHRVELVPAGEDVRGRAGPSRSAASRRCRRGSLRVAARARPAGSPRAPRRPRAGPSSSASRMLRYCSQRSISTRRARLVGDARARRASGRAPRAAASFASSKSRRISVTLTPSAPPSIA